MSPELQKILLLYGVTKEDPEKEDLKKVINNIEQIGGKVAGIVINMIPTTYKIYEKSYYYGSSSKAKVKTGKRIADPKKSDYSMMGENND